MNEDLESLFKRHQAFYEVAAYYVIVSARRVHAGFDVDVYAARTDHMGPFMPPPDEYAQASVALETVASHVSQNAPGVCAVEAFLFPSTVTFGVRGHAGEPAAMFRIRITAPFSTRAAGAPETGALAEVERQLKALGIARQ